MSDNDEIARLRHCLVELMSDARRPVRVGTDFAIRDRSLAQGLGGVVLSLVESDSEVRECIVDEAVKNVFEADIGWEKGSIRVTPAKISAEVQGENMGDLFLGRPAEIWTRTVFGLEVEADADSLFEAGPIQRPGLGHGDLSRELVRAIAAKSSCTLSHRELIPSGGWCNGSLGMIVALSWDMTLNVNSNWGELQQRIYALINDELQPSSRMDSSLCHGFSGIIAVGASLGRLAGDTDFIEFVDTTWRDYLNSEKLITPPSSTTSVDFSWLTGIAGLVWTDSILRRQPIINPLVPWDSLMYYNRLVNNGS